MLGAWFIGFIVVIFAMFWACNVLWRWVRQTSGASGRVRMTALGGMGIGNLPLGLNVIALIGSGGTGRQLASGRELRPTFGMRFISVVLTVLLLWLIWGDLGTFVPDDIFLTFPLTAAVIYAFAQTNLAYLRFDNDGFEGIDYLFRAKTARWADLVGIRDQGQYQYIFDLQNGDRLRVIKFMGGMPRFLAVASNQIARFNTGLDQSNAPLEQTHLND